MGKVRYALVTLLPLSWLVSVTFTAAWQKIFDLNPRIGFLAHARNFTSSTTHEASRLIFNDRLDAVVTGFLLIMVVLILLESVLECAKVLSGRKQAGVKETPFVASRFATEEQG
jgi:carbon starvation protein